MPQISKTERRDKAYGTLEAFADVIGKFTPPPGEFDPRGAWKQSYAIQLFGEVGTAGFLEIERRPASDGTALTVAAQLSHSNGGQLENARLLCAADKLGSLRSIELQSISSGLDGQPAPATKASLTAQVRNGSIEWIRGSRKRSATAPAPVAANWALFDAVQRLKPDGEKPIEFTLLDDGDLLKPAQRLVYVGKTSVQVAGGAALPLDCWEQTGYGVLPIHYWVDAKNRLLFAIAGQKAFFYDPDARNYAGKVEKVRAKGRRKQ